MSNAPDAANQLVTIGQLRRSQVAALARMRLQTFINWRRRSHGRVELASRVITGLWMGGFVVAGGIGIVYGSYSAVAHNEPMAFHAIFWPIFFFWQLFPLLATAFAPVFDASSLLRFPAPFSSFVALSLAYGCADPAALAGIFWLLCVAAGVGTASASLLPTIIPALVLFAGVNLVLGRAVFAWLEKWLAKRRAREIIGILFIFLILGLQLIGPVAERWSNRDRATVSAVQMLSPIERVLPPGFAAQAVTGAAIGDFGQAAAAWAALAGYGIFFSFFLLWRLRQQFRGEAFGESAGEATPAGKQIVAISTSPWFGLRGVSGATAAVLDKEVRYLMRSGPILFSMIIPVFVLAIFRISPARGGGDALFLSRVATLAFPIGSAYALLVLTNLIYNCLGIEGCGIQFYLMAPVDFRAVLKGKNLAYASLLAVETTIVWIGASVLYGPPSLPIWTATIAALAFGLLVNLTAGNLLSIYFPKKYDFSIFGRQRASPVALWTSLGIQASAIAVAASAFITGYLLHRSWFPAVELGILAMIAAVVYRLVLERAARVALGRRETLLAELCRAV